MLAHEKDLFKINPKAIDSQTEENKGYLLATSYSMNVKTWADPSKAQFFVREENIDSFLRRKKRSALEAVTKEPDG